MTVVLLIVMCLIGTVAYPMPIGLRTAVWGGPAAERLSAVEAAFPTLDDEATEEDVATALSQVADNAVSENINDVDEYVEFREWAKYANAADVKTNLNAWFSFAIGSDGLVPALQEDGLSIDDVNITADGKLEAVFSRDGILIDSGALESRLKTLFGVEGAATLDENLFSDKGVGFSLAPTDDGRIKAVVATPTNSSSFFMRIKVK